MDVYLNFSRAFDTFSHSIPLEKLTAHGLGKCTLPWVKTWLEGWAQSMGLNCAAGGGQSLLGIPKAQYWGQSCLMSSLVVWMRGLSVPSVSLQTALS